MQINRWFTSTSYEPVFVYTELISSGCRSQQWFKCLVFPFPAALGPWTFSSFLLKCQSVEHQFSWCFWPFDSTCVTLSSLYSLSGGSKTYLDLCRWCIKWAIYRSSENSSTQPYYRISFSKDCFFTLSRADICGGYFVWVIFISNFQ